MIKLKILIVFSITFFLNFSIEAKEPAILIEEIVNEASMILSSSDPVESKIIKLNAIAERNVDIEGIGRYTLGKFSKNLSEDDKIKFKKLFKSFFLKSFSSRLIDYSDPKINIVGEKVISNNYTIVNTILEETSKNPQIEINWRIYTKNPDRPLIRDLMVGGLSLARVHKEEFKSIILSNNGDIKFLFKSLEEFIIK